MSRKICYVRFKRAGTPKPFLIEEGYDLNVDDLVVAESDRGITIGKVIKIVDEKDVHPELPENIQPIIRKATEEDIANYKKNLEDAKEAFKVCLKKIAKHNLPMKLVDAEFMLDKDKVVFYFTADGRIDFRELVRDLARHFKIRIEMRQIGVRDEAKMIGCIGNCGRVACCATFLYNFQPISLKIARDQNVVLNPAKISGPCGRLLCCLSYEHELYLEKVEMGDEKLLQYQEEFSEEELRKLED